MIHHVVRSCDGLLTNSVNSPKCRQRSSPLAIIIQIFIARYFDIKKYIFRWNHHFYLSLILWYDFYITNINFYSNCHAHIKRDYFIITNEWRSAIPIGSSIRWSVGISFLLFAFRNVDSLAFKSNFNVFTLTRKLKQSAFQYKRKQ